MFFLIDIEVKLTDTFVLLLSLDLADVLNSILNLTQWPKKQLTCFCSRSSTPLLYCYCTISLYQGYGYISLVSSCGFIHFKNAPRTNVDAEPMFVRTPFEACVVL